jgi:hypothetical protein
MDSFELDLEDLDLKSVDMGSGLSNMNSSNGNGGNSSFKNISFNSSGSGSLSNQGGYNSPNLTISNSNNDPMPSMSGLSSDKEVDFGLNLLVNKKKQRPEAEITKLGSSSSNPSPTFGNSNSNSNSNGNKNSFSSLFNDNSSGGDSMPQKVNFDESEFLQKSLFDDNLTNIDLDKELNSMDLNDISKPIPSMSGPSLPNFGGSSSTSFGSSSNAFGIGGTSGSSFNGNGNFGSSNSGSINTGGVSSTENLSFEEIQKRKFDLLCKFERLRDKGIKLPKTFSMSSSYEEMNQEYDRLVYHRKMENSVKMQRRMLVSFSSMAEFVNNKTGNPFDINLDGWSEHMNEEVSSNNFDDLFEELYDKYKESANMAPELKLVFMVASSAFWFHISNNMAKSVMPDMDMNKIFKQNPELMAQFKNAAMGSMGQSNPGMANFMSGMGGMGGMSGPPKYNPTGSPPFSNPRDAPPRGSTNINSSDDIDALIDSMSN